MKNMIHVLVIFVFFSGLLMAFVVSDKEQERIAVEKAALDYIEGSSYGIDAYRRNKTRIGQTNSG